MLTISADAVFLYFLLTAVGDKRGLSYYSDNALALRLRTTKRVIVKARDELLEFDLIAFRAPITQVLSFPKPATERSRQVPLRSLFPNLLSGLAGDAKPGDPYSRLRQKECTQGPRR